MRNVEFVFKNGIGYDPARLVPATTGAVGEANAVGAFGALNAVDNQLRGTWLAITFVGVLVVLAGWNRLFRR